MVEDFWGPSKRLISDPKFVETLSSLDRDNLPSKLIRTVREKYLSNPDLNPDKVKSTIPAMDNVAKALYCWVVAVDMFEKVVRNLAPKRDGLGHAERDHQEALEVLNNKKKHFKEAQDKLK